MDLGFCGILDIILVIGAISFMVLGYFKGFIKKILSIFGILAIVVISFIYCGRFADFLIRKDVFYPEISSGVSNNILNKLANKEIAEDATLADVLKNVLNIPKFVANLIVKGNGDDIVTATDVANSVGAFVGKICMTIIAFFILFIGILIIIGILKLIATILRKNIYVRITDGILGSILYLTLFIAGAFVVFWIFGIIIEHTSSGFSEWLIKDMQLNTNKFRLSKWVYEANILKRIMDLIF